MALFDGKRIAAWGTEFEIVHAVNELDMEKTFQQRYGGLLSKNDFSIYRNALSALTDKALAPDGSLPCLLDAISSRQCKPYRAGCYGISPES